jgi:regulator of protease activity HflC (stomatin/prohibitin superfamily)
MTVPVFPSTDPRIASRAATAAMVGLAVELVLLLALGLTALWTESQAVSAATWHMACGLPIWLVLVLLYQQHDRERRDRLAAEQLAAEPTAAATIFAGLTDDLDAARLRLERIYRFGLPIVSLIVAVALLVAGGSLLWTHARAAAAAAGPPPVVATRANPVALMFVLAGVAFVAFVTGRWLAGYARQREWRLLRGGASYLMSCFVVAAVLFAGAATLAFTGDDRFFGWLAVVIPSLMIAVGLEILATALLESYRPRVPGEIPRPAFDSRMLGLLTAPGSLGGVLADLISYQFGVEVSGSWLYRLLGTAVTPLTILGAAVLSALSCIVIVAPDERAVILRGGAMTGEPRTPGMHFKLPWPIERAETHRVGQVHQIVVTSDLSGAAHRREAILWTTDNDSATAAAQEDFLAPPGASESAGGMALVSAEVIVQYVVRDLENFLLAAADPRQVLTVAAQREVSRFFATHDIDSLLGEGRTEGGPVLRLAIQEQADGMRLGVEVVGVAITAIHPPVGRVSRAFHAQIGAVQDRETLIHKARREAVEQLASVSGAVALSQEIDAEIRSLESLRGPDRAAAEARIDALLTTARGAAAERLHAARAYRWSRSVGERAEQDRFAGELLAYAASPDYYRARRFFEVLSAGLAARRKFVIAGDAGDTPVFRMDFSDPASALDSLLTE